MNVLLPILLASVGSAVAEPLCPDGSTPSGDACVRNVTQIEFEGLDVSATSLRPTLEFVAEHVAPRYPCDELRGPDRVPAWDTCMRNYYGSTDVADLSETIATRFAEDRACPTDTADITALAQIATHYAAHPRVEDLTPLQGHPLDVRSSAREPHLPTMCGYSVEQDRWYEPRSFYCDDEDCFAQAERGPKDLIRYSPLPTIPNLMKMVTAERGIASIGSGGGYGHLRLIPLGNDVFLATAGGMYGNVFFYGLVIVPQEEHYLRRACEGERQAAADGLGEARRRRLLGRAQELNAEADALVALRRISALLADPADTLDPLERVRLSRQALGLADVLRGAPAGDPPTEPGCARYQTWYPRAYEKVFASQIVATR